MKTNFVFATLVLLLGSCSSFKISKQAGLDAVNAKKGVNLILPQTELILEIPLVTSTYTRGYCFDTSEPNRLLLGKINKKIVKALAEKDTLIKYEVDEINISTRAVPDPNKIYFVRTKELSWWNDRGLSLSFNENGFVNTAETSFENHIPEMVISAANTLVSVATTAAGILKGAKAADSTVCDKIKESLENLRKLRIDMLTNKNYSASDDEKVLDRKLLEIDKAELALLSQLFFYTTKKTEVVKVKLVLNDNMKTISTALFKIDGDHIILNSAVFSSMSILDNSGIACSFEPLVLNPSDDKQFILTLHNQSQLRINNKTTPPGKHGLPYNIPLNYQAVISNDNSQNTAAEVKIAQWGTIGFLSRSASLLDIEYNPETGALLKMKIEQKATLTADDLKSSGEVLNSAAESFKKPKPDELIELQHEQSILESKAAIQKLKKELSGE